MLGLYACGGGSENPSSPDIFLVVIDALRADHLEAYGYPRATSPCIAGLAAEGVVFETARSAANQTRSSVPSLFTGYFPSVHGVIDPDDRLSDDFRTLAEALGEKGYATAAWAPNPSLARSHNFGQGFEHYDDDVMIGDSTTGWERFETASKINSRVLDFIDANLDRPRFLYLHYRDVHAPYEPPPELRTLTWREPDERGERGVRRLTDEELGRIPEYMRLPGAPPFLDYMISQYDAEIRYTDGKLCELLDQLRVRNLLERSILLLTSDHGEAFLEHGSWNHGNELFEEEIRVPLLIVGAPAGDAGARLSAPVQGVDIYPTILDFIGVEAQSGIQGWSLVPLMTGQSWPERPVFAEGKRGVRTTVIDGDWKLLRHGATSTWRLFNLREDPGEQFDRFSSEPEIAKRLARQLHRMRRESADLAVRFPTGTALSTPRLDAELRALGYLR